MKNSECHRRKPVCSCLRRKMFFFHVGICTVVFYFYFGIVYIRWHSVYGVCHLFRFFFSFLFWFFFGWARVDQTRFCVWCLIGFFHGLALCIWCMTFVSIVYMVYDMMCMVYVLSPSYLTLCASTCARCACGARVHACMSSGFCLWKSANGFSRGPPGWWRHCRQPLKPRWTVESEEPCMPLPLGYGFRV